MNETDIATALATRLSSVPSVPAIVWDNINPGDQAPPYVVATMVAASVERFGISKAHYQRGRLIASVVIAEGIGTAPAEAIAQAIIGHFPADLRLTADDGRVAVVQRPWADDGFHDGAFWRVNVNVRWLATTIV